MIEEEAGRLRAECAEVRAENERLRTENEGLRAENAELRGHVAELLELIAELRKRIAELEEERRDPPTFVKRNRPKPSEPKKPRKKRAKEHNHARERETATSTVRHALDRCPECNYRLRGESLDYARQVIELPGPQPVGVIEHQVVKRYCPHCEAWRSPKLDLRGQVVGQGRMGVGIVSLIGYLRQSLRLGIAQIQEYLQTMHQLTISQGEIVELLHRLREATAEVVEGLKERVRDGAVVHADETGWRENGQNGYIWSFSTIGEQAVRYYEYDPTRSQAVVRRILGDKRKGHLVSDFYCGYNDYAGPQQRCWIHLLRDLRELKDKHPEEADVVDWAEKVRALYDDGKAWLQTIRGPTREERERKYVELVEKSHALAMKYTYDNAHPCNALAKRLLRHETELFQFVLVEGLSPDNNLAERSIRPLVVIRKISGGSRGDKGTKTRMALATLFHTWKARGSNPLQECYQLLTQPAPTGA
jgi:transposase